MSKIKDFLQKIRDVIQKVRIEFLALASFIMAIIAFSTNYYSLKFNGSRNGLNIFDNIFNIKIGWLFFLIVLFGYGATIALTTLDNQYSKRAKLSFLGTIGFTAVMFLGLVIWVIADNDFIFGKENILGFKMSGGFGFAFYWFIIHLITSGLVVYLYESYQGSGEVTVYRWVLGMMNSNPSNTSSPKPKAKSSTDKFEELKKVKELFDQGILTEEEYLKEKKDILDKYQ